MFECCIKQFIIRLRLGFETQKTCGLDLMIRQNIFSCVPAVASYNPT